MTKLLRTFENLPLN